MNPARRAELQEAMVRLSDGDRAAFPTVFGIAWPLLRGFARAALRGSVDGEDAAQQALIRVFERASEFEKGRDALPWMLGIAMNECRSLRRKGMRRREEPLESAPSLRDGEPSPEERTILRDLDEALKEVLTGLPEKDTAAILESLRPEKEKSPPAFRKRLERARRRLREAWSARHGTC